MIRRRSSWLGPVAACAVLLIAMAFAHSTLLVASWPAHLISGWTLAFAMLLLAVFNIRKRLTFLPAIASATTWLKWHICLGCLSVAIFVLHTGARLPRGRLEVWLAGTYALVTISGILGTLVSRYFARQLTTRGDEVIYERIPVIRKRLADEATQQLAENQDYEGHAVVADHFVRRLHLFFAQPRYFWQHVFQSQRPRKRLLSEIESLRRFVDASGNQLLDDLAHQVRLKDDLDFHYALQTVLKCWLFIHIPLTPCLLVLTLLHGIAAHLYTAEW